jgi:hypothetical protein
MMKMLLLRLERREEWMWFGVTFSADLGGGGLQLIWVYTCLFFVAKMSALFARDLSCKQNCMGCWWQFRAIIEMGGAQFSIGSQ